MRLAGSAFPAGRGNEQHSNAGVSDDACGSGGATVLPGWR